MNLTISFAFTVVSEIGLRRVFSDVFSVSSVLW